jgi:hypothetical protein
MAWSAWVGRAAGAVVSGVAGVAVVEGAKKLSGGRTLHETAVAVTTLGLRGARVAEAGAERVRLGTADVVAEARERMGEQAAPPGTVTPAHDHEH